MIIYEEILRDLQKQKVRYVLVGGIAVNLHGYMRNTVDLDILLEMQDKNLAKAVNILKKHGYYVRQPVDPMAITDKDARDYWIKNKNMKALNFYKEDEFQEVDIVIESAVSYDMAKKKLRRVKIGDIIIPVIGLHDLIRMKKKSGRDLDKIDIKALKKIDSLRKKR